MAPSASYVRRVARIHMSHTPRATAAETADSSPPRPSHRSQNCALDRDANVGSPCSSGTSRYHASLWSPLEHQNATNLNGRARSRLGTPQAFRCGAWLTEHQRRQAACMSSMQPFVIRRGTSGLRMKTWGLTGTNEVQEEALERKGVLAVKRDDASTTMQSEG